MGSVSWAHPGVCSEDKESSTGGWCPGNTMLARQGAQALEASGAEAPGETEARPDCPRAGTFPQAASRKEVSTA